MKIADNLAFIGIDGEKSKDQYCRGLHSYKQLF